MKSILDDLSARELAILGRAISYAQKVMDSTGKLPGCDELRREMSCDMHSAQRIRRVLVEEKLPKIAQQLEDRQHSLVSRTVVAKETNAKRWKSNDEYLFVENLRLQRALEKARYDLNNERRLKRNLARNHAGYDELLENISTLSKLVCNVKLPSRRVRPARRQAVPPVSKRHSEDAVFVVSDTHFSDQIRSDDTSGFPEFDLEISGNRWGYVVDKVKQVLSLHRAMYPIDTLYVPILGDICNGELHDAPLSNQLFYPAQIDFSAKILKLGIEDLLTLVDTGVIRKIKLLFSVGNHTRLDIHMPLKYQAQRTWDWLIYQILIEHFKNDKRVEINSTLSPFLFENIRGHRYMFTHGFQVGYHNKPEKQTQSMSAFIALVRALFDSPVYRKKAGLAGETFSRIVIGDIHVPVDFPRLLSNGSLNGQNELGVSWGLEPIPAGQQLFGVSESHIQTFHYFINCTDVQRENPNDYALFAKQYAARFGR